MNTVQLTQLPTNDAEVRTKVLATAVLPPLEPTELLVYIYRTSSWYKAKASVAWIRRAVFNLKSALATCRAYCSNDVLLVKATNASKNGQSIEISPLKVQELVQSENVILYELQHHHFGLAVQFLKNLNGSSDTFLDRNTARRRKEVLKKTSCLYKLDPFIDKDGPSNLWAYPPCSHTSGSQTSSYPSEEQSRHQPNCKTLPPKDWTSPRTWNHPQRDPSGWVLDYRWTFFSSKNNFQMCYPPKITKPTANTEDVGPARGACFTDHTLSLHTGMDVFGPFYIKEGRKTLKRYGLIFNCLASRAVLLETLNSMEADSFSTPSHHQTCRCFARTRPSSRQGISPCQRLRLDKFQHEHPRRFAYGSNLGKGDQVSQISPLGSTARTGHPLRTLMTEAENVINSRLLTVENLADPASPEPITPNHLLTLKSQVVLPPPGSFQQFHLYSRKRWHRVQYLANQFWIRWC